MVERKLSLKRETSRGSLKWVKKERIILSILSHR
jgi:hypothetical protein